MPPVFPKRISAEGRRNPEYGRAYYNRGNSKARLGRYEEAMEDYGEAVRIDPEDAAAYNNRGFLKAELGRSEDAAAKDCKKPIELKIRTPQRILQSRRS